MKNNILKINEIFKSIQGESTYMGLPCAFIRLTSCNLRCTYCDTDYSFYEGEDMTLTQIINSIIPMKTKLVEITGGEPMLQKNVIPLMNKLLNMNYTVLLETSGAISLKKVPEKVKKIVDFKCPSSGMADKNLWSILGEINKEDQIKFVIGNKIDYEWTKKIIRKYQLDKKWLILFSPVFETLSLEKLSRWILNDNLNVRLQIQMHKYIWGPEKRGV